MHYELRLLYCMNFLTSKTVKNDLNIFIRAPEDVIVCLIWTSKQGKVSSLHIKEYGSSKYLVFLVEKDWFLIIFMVSNSHSMLLGFFLHSVMTSFYSSFHCFIATTRSRDSQGMMQRVIQPYCLQFHLIDYWSQSHSCISWIQSLLMVTEHVLLLIHQNSKW